jgi:nucleoside-diphosphate-sugar epimerase
VEKYYSPTYIEYNELSGNKAGIIYRPRRDWDKKSRLLSSIEKARRVLIYEPSVNFKDGLEKTHLWFKANWSNIRGVVDF